MQPIFSLTMSCAEDLGNGQVLKFTRTLRQGANEKMIDETLRHLLYAIRMMQAGKYETTSVDAKNRPSAPGYGNGHPMVSLSCETEACYEDRWYHVVLQDVNEHTSAQHILDLARAQMRDGKPTGAVVTPLPGRQAQGQSQTPPVQQPPQTGQTGRASKPPQAQGQGQPQGQAAAGDTPQGSGSLRVLRKLDGNVQLTNGETVRIEVAKISLDETNGVRKWLFYNPYGNNPGRYPTHALTLYSDNEAHMNMAGEFLRALPLQPGGALTGKWHYTGEVVLKNEQDKEGNPATRIYINVKGITGV